jgi:hypothetical protein
VTTITPTTRSVPLSHNGYLPVDRLACPVCQPSPYRAITVRRARVSRRVLSVHAACHRLDLDGTTAILWAVDHGIADAEGRVP